MTSRSRPASTSCRTTTLADHNGADIGKYHVGIGQQSMSVAAADEDIVTMAAAAAAPIVARHGTDQIRTVAVRHGVVVDQAKAAGVYVHSLLGLPSATRVVELKQACYGGDGGPAVRHRPRRTATPRSGSS